MTVKPILILSSWGTGSNAVAGFFGECGSHLCPPFLPSSSPHISETFESQMFAGMCMATIDETSFEPRVDKNVFLNGFKNCSLQEVEVARTQGKSHIVLKHPLAALLLDEICQVIDPIFVVVTRPFDKIEETRNAQKWPENQGFLGAQIIYNEIFSYLTEKEKTFFTIPISDFMNVGNKRLQLLDYCDLDLTNKAAENAFRLITKRN